MTWVAGVGSVLRIVADEKNSKGQISRREWLRIGGLSSLGTLFPFPNAATVQSAEPRRSNVPGFGRAKSVIVVFTSGGQSQLETWDPKPDAPLEVRGEFKAIPTSVAGTQVCEHMPLLAKLVDRLTIVRTMSHEDLDHGSALYLSLTGRYHIRRSSNPPAQSTDLPCYSSVLKRVMPSTRFIDTAVHINAPAVVAPNTVAPGQAGGLLGRDYDPMIIGDVTEGSIAVPGLSPQDELPAVRLQRRQSLLAQIETSYRRLEQDRRMVDASGLYRRAFEMLADPKTRDAFNLAAEPDHIRNRYGRNRSGQSCLLARRMVEAGVPLTTVVWNHRSRGQDLFPGQPDFYGWDTHNDIFGTLKNHLLPRFDQSFSALIEDLDDRGLLDETLVVCMGEFGRAPLVALEPRFAGASAGRKHWASVYSIAIAGAGVGRGNILGQSDRLAAYPASEKFGPWDVCATIFSALGIDPSQHYHDLSSLPRRISIGTPMTGLYA